MLPEIRNATIDRTELANGDRGPTGWIFLDYGGAVQGFGGYHLGDKAMSVFVLGILETLGVERWEDLEGTPLRAKADHGKVYAIGHYLKDKWFDIADAMLKAREGKPDEGGPQA